MRSAVLNTRFQCSGKGFGATINGDNVRARDVTSDEAVLADVDIMLACLALYST